MENVLAPQHHLLYFVKYPEPGRVKTRLAASLGAGEAARLYGELARSTLEQLGQTLAETVAITVAFDPPWRAREVARWLAGPYLYVAQQGGSLGERLVHAFAHVFSRGASRVLALGSDTLDLTPDLVREAFDALESHDVALGPARDGGYYLIALRREQPALFDGVSWSTPRLLPQTLSRIAAAWLSCRLLPVLDDLDDETQLNFRGRAHEVASERKR